MSARINGAFPQSSSTYINARQPLRLELFAQYQAKMRIAFGYKDNKMVNPNTNEDTGLPP